MELYELVMNQLATENQPNLRGLLDREAVRIYCKGLRGVNESLELGKGKPFYRVWDNGKLFFAQLFDNVLPMYLQLQCKADRAESLRASYSAISEAKGRISKRENIAWNEVLLDGTIPPHVILELIDHSYDLAISQLDDRERHLLSLMDRKPIGEDQLRGLISFEGLSNHTDSILGLLRPAIRLKTISTSDYYIVAGQSKFGGQPDFPPGMEWPLFNGMPLSFLAQLNMADVPDCSARSELPKSGILYIFAEQGWSVETCRLIFYEGEQSSLKRQSFPSNLSQDARYKVAGIEFLPQLTFPDVYSYQKSLLITNLDLNDDEQERLINIASDFEMLVNDLHEYSQPHQLLGYDIPIQAAMIEPWEQLLIQIGSDNTTGFMWGDVGTLYFIVSEDDLKEHNFARIRVDSQDY